MTNSETNNIPPTDVGNGIKIGTSKCKVCGDEASGCHYGVDACEGCKGFFRRSTKNGMNHKCTSGATCEITISTRNACQACRFQKCLEVGMAKENCRLGRKPKKPNNDVATKRSQRKPLASAKSKPSVNPSFPSTSESTNVAPGYVPEAQSFAGDLSFSHQTPVNSIQFQNIVQSYPGYQIQYQPQYNQPDYLDCFITSQLRETSPYLYSTSNQDSFVSFQLGTTTDEGDMSTKLRQYLLLNESDADPVVVTQHNTPSSCYDIKQSSSDPSLDVESGYSSVNTPLGTPGNSRSPLFFTGSGAPKKNPGMVGFENIDMDLEPMFHIDQDRFTKGSTSSVESGVSGVFSRQMSGNSDLSVEDLLLKASLMDVDDNLLNQVQTDIITAHMKTCNYTSNRMIEAERVLQEKIASGQYAKEMAGEKMKMMNMSGDQMWAMFLEEMIPIIKRVIKFFKFLPDFQRLEMADRVDLVKRNMFQVIALRYCALLDSDHNMMWDFNTTKKLPRALLANIPTCGPFLDKLFTLAKLLNPLKLTDEEVAFFSAFLAISSDCLLLDAATAENLRLVYLKAFVDYIRATRKPVGTGDEYLELIMQSRAMFEDVNQCHLEMLRSARYSNEQVGIELIKSMPLLHREIFLDETAEEDRDSGAEENSDAEETFGRTCERQTMESTYLYPPNAVNNYPGDLTPYGTPTPNSILIPSDSTPTMIQNFGMNLVTQDTTQHFEFQ